jgi:hypothetical protein
MYTVLTSGALLVARWKLGADTGALARVALPIVGMWIVLSLQAIGVTPIWRMRHGARFLTIVIPILMGVWVSRADWPDAAKTATEAAILVLVMCILLVVGVRRT